MASCKCLWFPSTPTSSGTLNLRAVEMFYVLLLLFFLFCGYEDFLFLILSVTLFARMWKFHKIGLEMISLVIRHDLPVPARIVNLFISNLVHDSLNVRKVCHSDV